MEKKIIVGLNEVELRRFGFVREGTYYKNKRFPIKLVITDVEGSFLVDWDDLQLCNQPTPPPVTNNSELLGILVSIAPYVVRRMDRKSVSREDMVSESIYLASELFSYIDGIILIPNLSNDGRLSYIPGNPETLTLMLGEESHFKIRTESGKEVGIYTHESCISYNNVFEMVGEYPVSIEKEEDSGKYVPFFGIGISFPKIKKGVSW